MAAVIRMAKWLNMPVVAEGVERIEQVEFLRSIGCEYVQGYYFAKPMPCEEFKALLRECSSADILYNNTAFSGKREDKYGNYN